MKPKRLKLYHYGHPRALFDSRPCRLAFAEDRRHGAMYGPFWIKDLNRFAKDAEEASMLCRFCPYCGAEEGAPP